MTRNVIVEYSSDLGENAYDALDGYEPGIYTVIDVDTGKRKVLTICGESKTDQSYKEMTSVKAQVRKAEAKGLLRANTQFKGEMDDFPDYDFQEAQFMLARAATMYEELPSSVRNKFKTPADFMTFANNPDNAKQMIDMGLAKSIDGFDKQGQTITNSQGQQTKDIIDPPEPTDTPQGQ